VQHLQHSVAEFLKPDLELGLEVELRVQESWSTEPRFLVEVELRVGLRGLEQEGLWRRTELVCQKILVVLVWLVQL